MKNEDKDYFGSAKPLTSAALHKLKDKGFRYLQVKGFSSDKRLDYMEPRYFILVPLKELPQDTAHKGIYEPIDSDLLEEWANVPGGNTDVLIRSSFSKSA